jgi:MOSC domain-containing protein YiiM
MPSRVVAVSLLATHAFSKTRTDAIHLLVGLGVEGDAHCGETVRHRSRVRQDPTQPNLRQVHLLHAELFDELAAKGFAVMPGQLGENITTLGLDLLELSEGTVLRIGGTAEVKITGLRNPCSQIDDHSQGLLSAVLGRDDTGKVIRKAGVMGVVLVGGYVRLGDSIIIERQPTPHRPLERV